MSAFFNSTPPSKHKKAANAAITGNEQGKIVSKQSNGLLGNIASWLKPTTKKDATTTTTTTTVTTKPASSSGASSFFLSPPHNPKEKKKPQAIEPPPPPGKIITITNHAEKYDKQKKKKYVDYEIQINIEGKSHVINHRYSEFNEFHKRWSEVYSTLDVPLPSKKAIPDQDERANALEAYLNKLCEIAALRYDVSQFLSIPFEEFNSRLKDEPHIPVQRESNTPAQDYTAEIQRPVILPPPLSIPTIPEQTPAIFVPNPNPSPKLPPPISPRTDIPVLSRSPPPIVPRSPNMALSSEPAKLPDVTESSGIASKITFLEQARLFEKR